MKRIYLITFGLLLSVTTISKAQVTVNGGPTANYTSVNAAFTAINAGTHFGAITIDITGNTTEPTTPVPLNASGQGGANYSSIILRPTVTATISGAMVTGRGVLELDGSDNVTIDGDIAGGPVTRELTIVNSAAPSIAATAAIRLIGRTTLGLGATNNTIKNCVIYGNTEGDDGISASTVTNSYGIYAGTNAAAIVAGSVIGVNYDNNTIENNDIRRAYFGIYIGSATANTSDNLIIANNIIGSNTVGETITAGGISLSGVTTSTLIQNEIFNLKPSTTVSPFGINLAGTGSSSVTISRNKIYGIKTFNTTTGYGAHGMNISGGNDHLIVNNVVYDIIAVNKSSTLQTLNAFGIRITTGTGHRVYYNSVNLFGNLSLLAASATGAASSAFVVSSAAATGLDIRNNIFSNTQFSTLPAVTDKKFMAVWFAASYDFTGTTLNNNSYNVTNDAEHFVGKIGVTNNTNEYQTLGSWQAASQFNNPTNDLNSIPATNIPAPFTSPFDLTIPANTLYGAESGAVLIPSLGTNIDYNGAVRPLAGVNPNLNPDMGAYEFDGIAGIAIDAGLTTLVTPAPTGCYSALENVVVTIKNYGTAAISNVPVNVNVSGAATAAYSATYAPSIAPGGTANFTVGVLNMLPTGNYVFNGATALTGDGNASNDILTTTTRTVVAPSVLPQFVDFTGFTGSNLTTFFPEWREGTGATIPLTTASAWTSQNNLNAAGNVNARLYLSAIAQEEWIVGPKISATANTFISFDAALTAGTTSPFANDAMGSDDKVMVMVSTDCGVSYTPVFTVSATNSLTTAFTNFNVSLSAYAGQDIIVAFLGTDGPIDDPETAYFHLDNVNLYNASPTDAGLSTMTSPGTGCYSAAENVVVVINNYGTSAISNIPVTVEVSGAVSQTLNATYVGTIPVASSVSFTVGVLNMTTPGVYTFTGTTSLPGDLNAQNDAMPVYTKTVLPIATLPQQVDFTGFTGANLVTLFPDWREGTGAALPLTAASAWTSQNNFNTAGNVNARLYLSAAAEVEWIVGPRITATASTNISFDAGISNNTTSPFTPDVMGSDDKVMVMVSTDCGFSYTPIFTITAANNLGPNFTNFTVPLGAYAGQDIIVAFLGTDGPVNDLEAYYFQLDNINIYNAGPADAGISSLISPTSGCFTANENVAVTINNYGTAALTSVPVTVIVSGAISQTLNATFSGNIAPASSTNFTVGVVNMTPAGTYSFNAYSSVTGDATNTNDSLSTQVKTVLPLAALPQAVNFTGFTGANLATVFPDWREGAGLLLPNGTTSSWTSQTNLNSTGNVNARMYLSATAADDWIVGPKVTATATTQISFDAAITGNITAPFTPDAMGSDDMVRLMISTDCGFSFTPIFTISATNSLNINFTNFTVPLGAYAGQDIILGFMATDGPVDDPEAYYFQLDNINLYNSGPVDAGILSLVSPQTNTCYGASESIVVDIKNYGTAALSNIPVTVTIAGPIQQTVSGTYAGPLAAAATATFNVGIANMSTGGVYTITSVTGVAGDPNTFNDASVVTITVNPIVGISGNTYLCTGGSSTLTATGAATSYTWSTSANTPSIAISPSALTVYSLTASDGTCTTIMSTTVTVTNPTISATGTTVCSAVTGTLSANAFSPSNVNWYSTPTSTVSLATGSTYALSAPTNSTVYVEAQSVIPGSLFTNVNGTSAFIGEMFDIVAVNAIEITNFDVQMTAGSGTIEIWYRPGTHVGFNTSNVGWTMAATTTVISNGPSVLTPIPATISVQIPAGQTYAFYLVTNTGPTLRYSTGTAVGNIYGQNADLQLLEGSTSQNYFLATTSPRAFNGQVHYNKVGCTSPRIPVTLTVNPAPSLSVTSSASIICTGQTVTLTASGANTYSWSTTSTNTVITVSPLTNTTYTLNGVGANSCTNTVSFTQSVSTCTGVDANLAFSNLINVYPNPSNGLITTDFGFEGEKEIVITNAVGQVITRVKTKNNSEVIDLKQYAKGIYFVKIINETNSANYRIVTQ